MGRRGAAQQLYVRGLDERDARPLPGTDDAQSPAISPDGQWVAFWADGAIRRVPLSGGPAAVVTKGLRLPPFGMTWGGSAQLYYGHPDGSIWRAAPDGVTAAVTKRLETELSHRLPFVLPGGEVLLFTIRKRRRTWGDEVVTAQLLATEERKVLLRDAADARYVPSGHLVFLRRGVLFAVAFDRVHLEVRGEPAAGS